jgi:inhibitor of cysteine peptidase
MTLELTVTDTGTTRSVRVGEQATLRLPENPTTGYRWQADYDPTRLRLVDDRFDGAPSPRGAGGERVLTFEAVLDGQTTLRLAKRRTWGDGEATEVFNVELGVEPTS